MAPLPSHGGQYRRFRNTLVAVVALVLLHALVSSVRGDRPRGLTALRGDSVKWSMPAEDEETEEREEVEHWDPQPEPTSNNWGGTPAKGGVEIYPLQPSRRPRAAPTPLVPEVAELEGVLTAWKMPEAYAQGGGAAMKGLYVMFHGCNHGPLDWFNLPEERAIVSHLVGLGYAVVAPGSRDRASGCWRYNTGNGDVAPLKAMLWRWYRDWSISPLTPLFLFGVSSGGNMATLLASKGGFQLSEKRTTFVQVSGVVSQVSWGVPPGGYTRGCPPIAFMPMPKGEAADARAAAPSSANIPPVFGDSHKIPQQITAIAHYVRKSGGRPRMLLMPLGEVSLYNAFFSDRVYEISQRQSWRLYNSLLSNGLLHCKPGRPVGTAAGAEEECFLAEDPRGEPQAALHTLVDTYFSPRGEGSVTGVGAEAAAAVAPPPPAALPSNGTAAAAGAAGAAAAASLELANRRRGQANPDPLPMLQPSTAAEHGQPQESPDGAPALKNMVDRAGGDGGGDFDGVAWGASEDEQPLLTRPNATEVFRELLNVAWGAHEISADFVGQWERWIWDSCGNCPSGPRR